MLTTWKTQTGLERKYRGILCISLLFYFLINLKMQARHSGMPVNPSTQEAEAEGSCVFCSELDPS
jgi:hypothetical protein